MILYLNRNCFVPITVVGRQNCYAIARLSNSVLLLLSGTMVADVACPGAGSASTLRQRPLGPRTLAWIDLCKKIEEVHGNSL